MSVHVRIAYVMSVLPVNRLCFFVALLEDSTNHIN